MIVGRAWMIGNGRPTTVIREEKTVCPKIGQCDKDCVIQRVGDKEK